GSPMYGIRSRLLHGFVALVLIAGCDAPHGEHEAVGAPPSAEEARGDGEDEPKGVPRSSTTAADGAPPSRPPTTSADRSPAHRDRPEREGPPSSPADSADEAKEDLDEVDEIEGLDSGNWPTLDPTPGRAMAVRVRPAASGWGWPRSRYRLMTGSATGRTMSA
nr:hypothetical protein [Deltaproteobacteria bacterium]